MPSEVGGNHPILFRPLFVGHSDPYIIRGEVQTRRIPREREQDCPRLVAIVGVTIFDPRSQVGRNCIFQAGANGPARVSVVNLAANGSAEANSVCFARIIRKGNAAGHEGQKPVDPRQRASPLDCAKSSSLYLLWGFAGGEGAGRCCQHVAVWAYIRALKVTQCMLKWMAYMNLLFQFQNRVLCAVRLERPGVCREYTFFLR